jgi:glycosyltransferase involved in cell wall biosynthesis
MRILHLIPALGHNGASRQVEILAHGLHRQGHQVDVCQLCAATAANARLEKAGISVHSLGWTRRIDPLPLWRLRGLLRGARPDIVHAWGRTPLRTLALVGRKLLGRVVLSRPFVWDQRQPTTALDRWLLGKVARIVVQNDAEAALAEGLPDEKIAVVSPGIALEENEATPAEDWPRSGRKVMCLGPLARHKGHRNAVWTFDFLKFIFEDLQLIFVGDGPDEAYLRQMARNVRRDDATHFLPPRPGAAGSMAQADVCWIPSVRGGGTQATLEAMLARRPVIACQVPSLDGLIVDGESGYCIPADDKVSMARRTRQILLDPGLGRRLGSQARERVLQHFGAGQFVERCQRIYQQVNGER